MTNHEREPAIEQSELEPDVQALAELVGLLMDPDRPEERASFVAPESQYGPTVTNGHRRVHIDDLDRANAEGERKGASIVWNRSYQGPGVLTEDQLFIDDYLKKKGEEKIRESVVRIIDHSANVVTYFDLPIRDGRLGLDTEKYSKMDRIERGRIEPLVRSILSNAQLPKAN